jgi:adenylate kinase
MKKWPAILIFGPPGSGKGTQAGFLRQVAPLIHLSTGDIFRSIPKTSELAQKLQSYSSQGLLVPDEVTLSVWSEYVQGLIQTFQFDPSKQILLLDGLPRTLQQAKLLESWIEVKMILKLEVQDTAVLAQRLSKRARLEGRLDDADEHIVRTRLTVYKETTEQTLSHYPASIIRTLQADAPMLKVLRDILDVIHPFF